MDIESFGMYEGYTHFANILIANFRDSEENVSVIRDILNDYNVEGGVSLTQHNYISIKILGYNSDKLIQVSDKISDYLINSYIN